MTKDEMLAYAETLRDTFDTAINTLILSIAQIGGEEFPGDADVAQLELLIELPDVELGPMAGETGTSGFITDYRL